MSGNVLPIKVRKRTRPWLLIAAYDVSLGESSEGYVAFNVLQRLAHHFRIVLVTRRNNQQLLLEGSEFREACPGVHVLGFDLPRWASWWKRGARFYGLYAYLWQLTWPIALRRRARFCGAVELVHVLNFHNDSIPSLAWTIGRPVVWGPVNHNEYIPHWRRTLWPRWPAIKHQVTFFLRCLAWHIDPLLWMSKRKADVIFSAGSWVDHRLKLDQKDKVIRLSQLGVDAADFSMMAERVQRHPRMADKLLVVAGRLDWLKGVDIAIEALLYLPEKFRLLVVGKGPAEEKLKQWVEQLGLVERVEFRSPVSRTELARIYANASLFLFTSPEVAGLAWVEALACGLPVVGFAANTELARSGSELLGVNLAKPGEDRVGHVRHFAEVIAHAAIKEQDRASISRAALDRYGWGRMVEIIESGYRKALGERC